MTSPQITAFHETVTGSLSYVIADPATKTAAVVDPVLNYDAASGRTATTSADQILAHVREKGLTVAWILETHVHADHLSAAMHIKAATGAPIGIGEHVRIVQKTFGTMFNVLSSIAPDAGDFDRTFKDGERFRIGNVDVNVLHTPGHTPACISYVVGDAVFVGDALFMPDYGTARCDFPGGDAATLYRSIQRILSLPDTTRIFVGHDYGPEGREIAWESTVAAQKAGNIHIGNGAPEDKYVAMRTARDKTLALPALIIPSVQVNMRAGRLPAAEDNGTTYLKIPLNKF